MYQTISSLTTVLSWRICCHSTPKGHPHNAGPSLPPLVTRPGKSEKVVLVWVRGCWMAREMRGRHRNKQREEDKSEQKGKRMDPWETEEVATCPVLPGPASSLGPASHHLLGFRGSPQALMCVSSSESAKLKVQYPCLVPRTQLQPWHQGAPRINKWWALGPERSGRSTRNPQHDGQCTGKNTAAITVKRVGKHIKVKNSFFLTLE